MKNKKIVITGSSGFIGFHVSKFFLENKYTVIGIDNHDNYYDVQIKNKRLKILKKFKNFKFFKKNILEKQIYNIFNKNIPDIVIHLAAQAGVRFSFDRPQKYIDNNIKGFLNILEIMRKLKLNNLIYASSSSVYGNTNNFPTKENSPLNPENIYGMTKVFNENLAKFYCKKFKINSIGLRFFTVYGKIGRPDMFIPKITNKIKNKKNIELYNNGNHHRDFTYVDDVASVIFDISKKIKDKNKNEHQIYNICYGSTVKIDLVIKKISNILRKKPKIKKKNFQIGDMYKTHGSNMKISKKYKFKNLVDITRGLKEITDND
tara:strand:- start:8 stop:961 length:954 start_codon:yes stop_codon:yes gene_type:complete